MAQAGLATAAAAGIWQRMRSKSRGGKSRSRTRVQTGVPIVAAGLGGAAVAGLYERNKARKEARRDGVIDPGAPGAPPIIGRSGRSRSRSRSRSVPYPEDDPGMRGAPNDPALIEYGVDPIYPDERGYDEPGEYRRRHRGGSSDSSPDGRRRRSSRSRSRSQSRRRVAEAAAAAGVAGVAAHEITKKNERKRAERERRRREEHGDYGNDHSPPYSPPPMGSNAGAYPPQHEEFYPSTNTFPPPPPNDYGGAQRGAEYPPGDYPPYNPSDYPPPPGATPAPGSGHEYQQDPNLGYGHPNETYAGDVRYHDGDHRGQPGPENVSPIFGSSVADDPHDGLRTPRPKSVQFDLMGNENISPEQERERDSRDGGSSGRDRDTGNDDRTRDVADAELSSLSDGDRKRRRRRRHRDESGDEWNDGTDDDRPDRHDRHRSRSRSHSRSRIGKEGSSRSRPPIDRRQSGSESDSTVDLPPRFDEQGRPTDYGPGSRPSDDPLTEKIHDMLAGRGTVGGMFKRFTGDLLGGGGGGGGGSSGDDERGSRRRRSRQ